MLPEEKVYKEVEYQMNRFRKQLTNSIAHSKQEMESNDLLLKANAFMDSYSKDKARVEWLTSMSRFHALETVLQNFDHYIQCLGLELKGE